MSSDPPPSLFDDLPPEAYEDQREASQSAGDPLVGVLDRITYQNPENHFLIGQFIPEKGTFGFTIKGTLFNVHEGQTLKVWGEWEDHRQYGRQFRVKAFVVSQPTTAQGIEKYLASGVIKGVGPVIAKRIVKAFGEDTLRVMDEEPEKLLEVPHFTKKLLGELEKSWEEQKAQRDILVFLHANGISQTFADRIFAAYGFNAIELIKENPYRLAMDIHGMGFRTADAVAQRLGFPKDSPQRADAGALYLLDEMGGEGHTCAPQSLLVQRVVESVEITAEEAEAAIERLVADGLIRPMTTEPEVLLFRPRMERAEAGVAQHLVRILADPPAVAFKDVEGGVEHLEGEWGIELAPAQRQAVYAALKEKVLVLTGGPGTGKTTIVKFILELVARALPGVALAAPTGKAAKRLGEATGRPASTIHRLLEAGKNGFERNIDHPLETELLVVDESSMMDTQLMEALLEALPSHARLVLVGDVDQLPSVGPGTVLADIIASDQVPVVRLEQIFRQSASSRITPNAHAIRQGHMPDISAPVVSEGELSDFYFMEVPSPERVVEHVVNMVTGRIPERFGLKPGQEVQVLTPMHRSHTGAQNLNAVLQEAINPKGQPITLGEMTFRVGDMVMQTRNDYEKGVFNGDSGRITGYDADAGLLEVTFDEETVIYERREADALMLAYAITVHKSQGSEYPAVVLPLTSQHAIMLQRNLLYTALTRGRRLVVIIGTEKALGMAVRNNRPVNRHTGLRQRLVAAMSESEETGEAKEAGEFPLEEDNET